LNAVFADTSALYALLVATDENHRRAALAFQGLERRRAALVTTSYVLVETYALLQRRVGAGAVRRFRMGMAALLDVFWIDGPLHDASLDLLLERSRSGISLVDAASFLVMRANGIEEAFAFDGHFRKAGFSLVK
jgi:predicted nucleic acid-binding protein